MCRYAALARGARARDPRVDNLRHRNSLHDADCIAIYPVCMDRMNAANGLTAGGKGQSTTIDPATFWKGTVAQRGGRALHDRDRGNDHLVRQLGEHIYDEAGRKLPEVVLHKLRSAEDEKAELAESSDEEGEGGKEEKKKAKKKKGRTHRGGWPRTAPSRR